jgi:hypothetical protein
VLNKGKKDEKYERKKKRRVEGGLYLLLRVDYSSRIVRNQ